MSFLKTLRSPAMALMLALGALTAAPTLAQEASAPASAAADMAPASAPDMAAAPADAMVSNVQHEEVENPYGLKAMWEQGDLVAKATLVIMIIMSVGSWYITFVKWWEQQKMLKSAKEARDNFWNAGTVRKGAEALREDSAFRYIAEQGLKASEHHEGTLLENIDLHTWIGMSVQRAVDLINGRLQGGLAWLATVGSTAPFVGLFGTVWGILHALTSIGISGQASIDKVAGPVGEALIMTAIGLAVAVPAVMGYNWLVRRNKVVMDGVRHFAGDVHNVLLAGKR